MDTRKIRDKYAVALKEYMETVPVEEWAIHGYKISKSGIQRALKERGFEKFERKRLESSACKPIVLEMEKRLEAYLKEIGFEENKPVKKEQLQEKKSSDAKLVKENEALKDEVKKLKRSIERYKRKISLMQEEAEQNNRQNDAFIKHCQTGLRTIHV